MLGKLYTFQFSEDPSLLETIFMPRRYAYLGSAFLLFITAPLPAQESGGPPNRQVKPPTSNGQFIFSLLPKSLDKNAVVDMTVFGEVTKAGAERPLPSAESPLYYVARSGGYQGGGSMSGERAPAAEAVDLQVQKSLRFAGYKAAEGEKKPDIVVLYHWGSEQQHDPESLRKRAILVGGDRFANELTEMLIQQREHRETQKALKGSRGMGGAMAGLGASFELFSPLEQFKRKEENNETLLEQAWGGLYYVIISAYDYDAMAKGQRLLLWRTRMTVDSSGVSFVDTMPALLANAAPYLGKDTGRAGTFAKKMLRRGTVSIGTATVVEDKVPETKPADQHPEKH